MSARRWFFLAMLPACVLGLGSINSVAGQEWSRFRGPNGQGVGEASNIPAQWTDANYTWKTRLPAAGHSSPVLWGDKIFLTCADDDETARRMVVCVDAKTGQVLWNRKYESAFHRKHKFNSFASATAAADEDHVYITWSTPEEYTLMALDHAGNEIWRRNLGPFVSQHSCGISPIVYQDLVILGNDQDDADQVDPNQRGKSFLLAVDRKTGKDRWMTERVSDIVAYSTPCVYQPRGGEPQLIFNSKSHGVTSIDPSNGSVNWEIAGSKDAPLLDKRSVSSPVLVAGMITASCGSGGGGNSLVLVQPGNVSEPPKTMHRIDQKDGAPYVPTPIAKGDLLFLWNDKGIVSCVDAPSGKVLWIKRVGGNYFGSPVLIDDRIYCVSTDGDVVVIKAAGEYEELATNSLGEMCHSTPAVANGAMYIRTYNHLICVGGKK